METNSLFMLVGERLLLYGEQMGMDTYNAMFEVLVQEPSTQILNTPHHEPAAHVTIQNPGTVE